ncbi:MAG: hypothetical protein NTX91_00780 [candidate division SR1 bacterium]|nr:hypothetical protein [candidate division SR1 bacterium]
MATKKIITLVAILTGMLSLPVLGGMITFQPMYSDTRFPPVDQFHAGCMQDAQVTFDGKETNISKIHLELQYVPDDVEISRILGVDQVIANYRIEYDRVIFDIDNPKLNGTTPLFHLSFQSKKNITASDIVIATGSYFVSNGKITYLQSDFPLQFATVPECDPDIIPPSVNVIFPQDPTAPATLDQYFVFEVKDADKGVDKNSIKITLNDKTYTAADTNNIKRKGNYITFYPQDRLPVNKKINLQVSISDLQSYGGANTTEKMFSFKTASGLKLLDDIDPMTLRMFARDAAKITGTPDECSVLQNFYSRSDASFQSALMPIINKMSCTLQLSATSTGDDSLFNEPHAAAPTTNRSLTFVSVFAALGRILFGISLILKLHYLVSYRKHKKLANMYKNGA